MTPQANIQGTVDRVLVERRHMAGALLPVLHGIQDALGYVPPEAVPQIADGLNLSRAEVHGVISFYHHFRDTPPGRHTVYLCRAESCQAMHGRALEAHAKNALGIDFHQTNADGAVTLEPIYCLGNCALSPAVMVDGNVHGRMTSQRLDALIAESRQLLAPDSRLPASKSRVPTPGSRIPNPDVSSCRATRARFRWARTKSRMLWRLVCRLAYRSSAMGRAVCTGSNRSSRSRLHRVALRTGQSRLTTWRVCSRPTF